MMEYIPALIEHFQLANELYGPARPEGFTMGLLGLVKAVGSLFGSKRETDTRVEANEDAAEYLREAHGKAEEEHRGTLEANLAQIDDYITLGKEEFTRYSENVRAGRYVQHPFQFGRQDLENDPGRPGYDFIMQEGLRAIQRNAAARGGLIGGNALRESSRYAANLANTFTNDAFQRAQNTYATNQGQLDKQHEQDRYLFDVGLGAQYDAVRQRELASQGIVNALVGAGSASAAGSLGAGYAKAQGIADQTNILFGNGLSTDDGNNTIDILNSIFRG